MPVYFRQVSFLVSCRFKIKATSFSIFSVFFLLAGLFWLTSSQPSQASAQSLNSVTDCSQFGPGVGTLQEALNGGGLIQFSCSGTITIPNTIQITTDTILDAKQQKVTLDGAQAVQLIKVNPGVNFKLVNLTLAHGNSIASNGGAIFNNGGNLEINGVTFFSNTTTLHGGAIYNTADGQLLLVNSTVSTNQAHQTGGGLYNDNATATVINSTFALNSGANGHSIVATNTGSVIFTNTILATSNYSYLDYNCLGSVVDGGNNLIAGRGCGNTIIDSSISVLPLGDNGGPTPTHQLIGLNVDKGNSQVCSSFPVNGHDQRGVARPQGANCDIGAIEELVAQVNSVADTNDGSCDRFQQGTGNQDCTLREAINLANSLPDTTPILFDFDIAFSQTNAITIAPLTELPPIVYPTILYDTLPSAWITDIRVTISGKNLPSGSTGLAFLAGSNLMQLIAISDFTTNVKLAGPVSTNPYNKSFNSWLRANIIGTNKDGKDISPTSEIGILIDNSPNNWIAYGNLIGGNSKAGIQVRGEAATNNYIASNQIGTNIDQTGLLPNGIGVWIENAPGNKIGESGLPDSQKIAGNVQAGILIEGSQAVSNEIRSNIIGTYTRTNVTLPGNGGSGIHIKNAPNILIQSNTIAGNGGHGIYLEGAATTSSVITNNQLGTKFSGNTNNGVQLDGASGSNISANTIVNNANGIVVLSGEANHLANNIIYSNTNMAIDLAGDGPTSNDSGDSDTGANQLQNYPLVTNASFANGIVNISGTLASKPNQTYTIELYFSQACTSLGYGQGQIQSASQVVTTGGNGLASFSFSRPTTLTVPFVSMLASDSLGNTSEFSGCVNATLPAVDPYLVTNPGDDGSATQIGTLSYAIAQANQSANPVTIEFTTDVITLTGILPLLGNSNGQKITLAGKCLSTTPGVRLNSTNPVGNITIKNNIELKGLYFAGSSLEVSGPGNSLSCSWLTGNTAGSKLKVLNGGQLQVYPANQIWKGPAA